MKKIKQIKIIFGILILIFLSATILALYAFPSGDTNLKITSCNAEDNSLTPNNYTSSCDATYPAACPADLLSCNEGSSETHTTSGNNQYAGITTMMYNSTMTNCQNISDVFLCSEWWSSSASINACTISVDANNGTSFTTINTTCPDTTANPGVHCQNVTANESWSCDSFFGTSGDKAFARMQVQASSAATKTITWDVLFFNVTYAKNEPPVLSNISASSALLKGGDIITIYANTSSHGVNDSEVDTLHFYCDNSTTPNSTNTDCTGGTTSDSTYPYALTCTFPTSTAENNYTEYCRLYDGKSYSVNVSNITYTIDSTPPTNSIISVASDTTASYIDTINDGLTDIIVSGEASMSCRWSSSDAVYSSMSNDCVVTGTEANCSANNIGAQGFHTRYISCKDSLGNEQSITQNLDVQFYLDYTAPTTDSNANTEVHVPSYVVTITELDNVDSDPTSYYCTSTSEGCSPTTSIDNGGTITYTSSDRGTNYLRFYSVDFAGNTQIAVNQTIKINQLPVFTSASDDAVVIKGGSTVNVSSIAYDPDFQQMSFYVCNSSGATISGCTGTEYCSSNGIGNMSCTFTSESDSSTHNWYAYVFDSSGEAATNNPLTGSYTTDSQVPSITLTNPLNNTNVTQSSVTITIIANEALTNAWYSLDSGANNVSMSNVSTYIYTHSNTSIVDGNYNISIWANDSYGNIGNLLGNSFNINTALPDTTAPSITIWSPINNTYFPSAEILLNLTSDEKLKWAGYKLNSDAIADLKNTSSIGWNATLTLTEGQNNLTFYANDTSNNQASKSIIIYIDLTNPSVDGFSCTNPANDSQDVNCSANVSDTIGLNYAIISYNTTGVLVNSSQISLTGKSATLSYIISADNTTTGIFSAEIYLYDLSGRNNLTENYEFNISDDISPGIYNITYFPNTTIELDPGVTIEINATIVENYNLSSVILMYKNSSASDWTSVVMTNLTDINYSGLTNAIYNASFVPQTETWYFKINATDTAGNQNISTNYTLVVANESSFWNGTTIPAIKSITYAQRTNNNSLGWIYLNNTGDNVLTFALNVSYPSSIRGKYDFNYTGNDTVSYTVAPHENISLFMTVNNTGVSAGLYPYNITITSDAGTTIYERSIYTQAAEGPYLQVSIDTYSSSVTTSQTGITYAASVSNLGTLDASDVVLTWVLPSIFTLTSGNLTRSFSTIPISTSGTSTITVDVGSATTDIEYYINVTVTSSNADSTNISKTITVSNPVTITQVVTTSTGGGGGSGAGSPISYSKIIEIVRGKQDSFNVVVNNSYVNTSLEELTLDIEGYLSQYIIISPEKIGKINSGEIGKFNVQLEIPSYKENYEEYTLKAIISGYRINGLAKSSYTETQNIKLMIQEVSREESNLSLYEAEQAILEMQNASFNTDEVLVLFEQAKSNLSNYRNKDSQILSQKILSIKDNAFNTDNLIRRIAEALQNPKESYLLVGGVVKDFAGNNESIPLTQLLTGKTIFGSDSTKELLELAIAAFERGDYVTAQERAAAAQANLLLERKGDVFLFVFLYWPFILMGIIVISSAGILSYKMYRKSSITKRIQEIDEEEDNIRDLIISSQKKYFLGKTSAGDYHKVMNQHQNKLAKIKQERLTWRNKRIKLLKKEQILQDLRTEQLQVEKEIKKLQEQFYRDKEISEDEYNIGFKILNERLAEIEEEKITFELLKEKKSNKKIKQSIAESKKGTSRKNKSRIILLKIAGFFKSPFSYLEKRRENKIKEKIKHLLK